MGSMKKFSSRIGFSAKISDGWGHNENVDIIDLHAKELERQKKWAEIGKDMEDKFIQVGKDMWHNEKAALMFDEVLSGLSSGLEAMELYRWKFYYDTLLTEAIKPTANNDEVSKEQLRFLLATREEASRNWKGLSGTILLIELQKATDPERLQAKEILTSQIGFFLAGDNKNEKELTNVTVTKFGMKITMTPLELYGCYKRSLPVWFWGSSPDKMKVLKNTTVDGGEIAIVENYRQGPVSPDSINACAVKGTTGWIIRCHSLNYRKYMKLFSEFVDTFQIDDIST